jgi:Chlorite dismutase
MDNRYAFVGSDAGNWQILSMDCRKGAALVPAKRVDLVPAATVAASGPSSWALHGLTSNVRYATRSEITALRATQASLGRDAARRAALIPIKKSSAWWELAQDERRAIFEDASHHTAVGLKYLPAIARQLFHCRDIAEPFDFLTWFEYAPEDAPAFDDLVGRLRSTTEWTYVEREIDIRLERA